MSNTRNWLKEIKAIFLLARVFFFRERAEIQKLSLHHWKIGARSHQVFQYFKTVCVYPYGIKQRTKEPLDESEREE